MTMARNSDLWEIVLHEDDAMTRWWVLYIFQRIGRQYLPKLLLEKKKIEIESFAGQRLRDRCTRWV